MRDLNDIHKSINIEMLRKHLENNIYKLNGNKLIEFVEGEENWSFDLVSGKIKASSSTTTKYYQNWQYLKNERLVLQLIKDSEEILELVRTD